MLASKFRLRKKDYDIVKKEGKLIQKANFGASVLKRNDNESSRFGFIVSTKISKLATQRNMIKRAMSEAVRHNSNRIDNGFSVIFLTKKSILNKSTETIMNEVRQFLFEQGLITSGKE